MVRKHCRATHGARCDSRVEARSTGGNSANTPVSLSGSAPAMIAIRIPWARSPYPTAAAYGPPIDQPITANRPTPRYFIKSSASAAQSSTVRPGFGQADAGTVREDQTDRGLAGDAVRRGHVKSACQAAVTIHDGEAGRVAVF